MAYRQSERLYKLCADPEGGIGGPYPPGKSQVIWVTLEISIWTPPGKKMDPPGKGWTPPPSEILENNSFL